MPEEGGGSVCRGNDGCGGSSLLMLKPWSTSLAITLSRWSLALRELAPPVGVTGSRASCRGSRDLEALSSAIWQPRAAAALVGRRKRTIACAGYTAPAMMLVATVESVTRTADRPDAAVVVPRIALEALGVFAASKPPSFSGRL